MQTIAPKILLGQSDPNISIQVLANADFQLQQQELENDMHLIRRQLGNAHTKPIRECTRTTRQQVQKSPESLEEKVDFSGLICIRF